MAVVIYGNFFFCIRWTGLRLRFSIVSVLRAGIIDVGHQRLFRHQYFAQSFPDVSGIIIKVDRGWSRFYIFNLLTDLCPLPPCFIPTFPRFLAMWRVLSHDSFSTIWIISSFQWRGDKVKRSINSQLDCAVNWGAQKWNFMVIYWKTNINIQIYS